MDTRKPRRLDEILLEQGLVSEEQIREALLRQKAHGGRFGSQLIYHQYVDEQTLVKALEIQSGCPGVMLSEYDIPEAVIQMIPKKVALALKVIPFGFDAQSKTLKVACEDPTDPATISEVDFIAREIEVEYFVAAEVAMNKAIAKYYLGQDRLPDDGPATDVADASTEAGDGAGGDVPADGKSAGRRSVLLITDEAVSTEHLQALFERDKYLVFGAESVEQARGMVDERRFTAVFIKDGMSGDHCGLIDRVRRLSPHTVIRYFDRATSLIMGEESVRVGEEILTKNNDLVTSLLSSRAGLPTNHSGRVGHYADKLCRKLNVPDLDWLLVANAAYLHDFAKYYYDLHEKTDNRRIVRLTVRLLSSINYPSRVLDILGAMYKDVGRDYEETLPLEALGGNILTIADLFCESIPEDEQLTSERLDVIRKRLRDLKGRLFLPEVVEVFLGLVQEEFFARHTSARAAQVMILSHDSELQRVLEQRLKGEGCSVIQATSPEEMIRLYRRSVPDVMLLAFTDKGAQAEPFIDECEAQGISFATTPCFLLLRRRDVARHIDLLERGIEDIIELDDNHDLLMTKIRRVLVMLRTRSGAEGTGKESRAGAHGRLADMNLIDLVQALGPGLKTARITVRPAPEPIQELAIFLKQGVITHAKLDDMEGPEAVYEGLTWADGSWVVEPIAQDEIPPQNTFDSNESILMEGCRRLDEKVKSGRLL